MKVFVENHAGSSIKHLHNEKTLMLTGSTEVSRPYPLPYGFVLNTTAEDGDNVDCFILTLTSLHTGDIVECEPVALMEQVEDGQTDHKVLAALCDDRQPVPALPVQELVEFATHVFAHIPGKTIKVGEFKGREAALVYLRDHQDTGTETCIRS